MLYVCAIQLTQVIVKAQSRALLSGAARESVLSARDGYLQIHNSCSTLAVALFNILREFQATLDNYRIAEKNLLLTFCML